ncbi:hypothetical protein B0H10DRAFT_1304675 [Mycena sp. CBHHK59/15]|nr:hypothetical protein B0H10DRAFT_1304675 [Mycena sp. CBHHK59/15]
MKTFYRAKRGGKAWKRVGLKPHSGHRCHRHPSKSMPTVWHTSIGAIPAHFKVTSSPNPIFSDFKLQHRHLSRASGRPGFDGPPMSSLPLSRGHICQKPHFCGFQASALGFEPCERSPWLRRPPHVVAALVSGAYMPKTAFLRISSFSIHTPCTEFQV